MTGRFGHMMDERWWSPDDVGRGDVRDGGHQMVMATVCHRRAVFSIFARGDDESVVHGGQTYCLRRNEHLQDDIFRCFMALSSSWPWRHQDRMTVA